MYCAAARVASASQCRGRAGRIPRARLAVQDDPVCTLDWFWDARCGVASARRSGNGKGPDGTVDKASDALDVGFSGTCGCATTGIAGFCLPGCAGVGGSGGLLVRVVKGWVVNAWLRIVDMAVLKRVAESGVMH